MINGCLLTRTAMAMLLRLGWRGHGVMKTVSHSLGLVMGVAANRPQWNGAVGNPVQSNLGELSN